MQTIHISEFEDNSLFCTKSKEMARKTIAGTCWNACVTGHLANTVIIRCLSSRSTSHGVTVISATHDHKMLDSSDRVVWISDGQIARVEKREDLDIQVGKIDGSATF